jgi:hypothetical protein
LTLGFFLLLIHHPLLPISEDPMVETLEPVTVVSNYSRMRIFEDLEELRTVVHRSEDWHDT